jgi:hypothetical protein
MEKTKLIDIKAESLPWQAKLIGVLMALGGLSLFTSSLWWLAILLVLGGLGMVTMYSGTEIDPAKKTYREYNSFLLLKTGSSSPYQFVEKIFINSEKTSQKMYTAHTLNSSTFHNVHYNAFIKFDNGEKIFLTTRKEKPKLMAMLTPIAQTLDTVVVDNTVQ